MLPGNLWHFPQSQRKCKCSGEYQSENWPPWSVAAEITNLRVTVSCGNSSLMLFGSLKLANTILEIFKTEAENKKWNLFMVLNVKGCCWCPQLKGRLDNSLQRNPGRVIEYLETIPGSGSPWAKYILQSITNKSNWLAEHPIHLCNPCSP